MAAAAKPRAGALIIRKCAGGFFLPERLSERLGVAFCLMSVIPLLVLGYILSVYVFPHLSFSEGVPLGSLTVAVAMLLWLALAGWYLVRNIVRGVGRVASEAQAIASGDLDRSVEPTGPGEIGELGTALGQITQRVRDNMEQLKAYGEQTRQLNLEINRRILSLSNVLQVSSLIAQSSQPGEVLSTILEKMGQLEDLEQTCLLEFREEEEAFLVRGISQAGADASSLEHKEITAPWLRQQMCRRRVLVLDEDNPSKGDEEIFQQIFGVPHGVCQPIIVLGKEWGVLVSTGGPQRVRFRKEILEILKVFAKQMSLALENQILRKRAQELEIIDELTGLYNSTYLKKLLEEEIRRAKRFHRPCAFALLNLDDFRQFREEAGGLAAEKGLRQVAQLLQGQVSEGDRVGRLGADEFGLVLPERNKREAVAVMENIRLQMERQRFGKGEGKPASSLTFSVGVSENPLDGATGEALMDKATQALRQAKRSGKNRVVTA